MKWYIIGTLLVIIIVLVLLRYFYVYENFQNNESQVFIYDVSGIDLNAIAKDLSGTTIDPSTVDNRLPTDPNRICDEIRKQINGMNTVIDSYRAVGDFASIRLTNSMISGLKNSLITSGC